MKCPYCHEILHQIGFDMVTPSGKVQHFYCGCPLAVWVKRDDDPLIRIETKFHLDESDNNNIVIDSHKMEEFE